MGLSLQYVLRYADEEDMLNRVVAVEESKRASMKWKHPSSPSTEMFVTLSAGKIMFTMFRDYQGVLLAHFLGAW
jgi:hypothetical protein